MNLAIHPTHLLLNVDSQSSRNTLRLCARRTQHLWTILPRLCAALVLSILCGCASTSDKPSKAQLLVQAAWDNDVQTFKQMISSGVNPNIQASSVVTSITGAQPTMVNGQMTLALTGEDYPGWWKKGCFTALSAASYKGNIEIVNDLLASKASVDDPYGALSWACMNGHADVVEALLAAKANPNKVFGKGSPLMAAIMSGASDSEKVRIVNALLIARADVNWRSPEGDSPLSTASTIAARTGHDDILKLLQKAGAR